MDAAAVLNDIRDALQAELGAGASAISGLLQSQGKLLAEQAALIAEQRVNGVLRDNDPLFDHFMAGLEANTRNLALSVTMLTALTIERAWNAIANVLWGALRTTLTAAGIPAPLVPAAPPAI